MFSLRKTSAAALVSFIFVFPATALAEGGFVALQAGVTDSQDMDKFGNVFKLQFGPNITEHFSLEFGLADFGEVSYNDPTPDFTDVADDNPPSFNHAEHGTVTKESATDTEQAVTTYSGFSSAHPQSFLITFRYRVTLTDDIDFFLKTGANIWWADYDVIEMQAFQDGTTSRRVSKSGQTSAVDQITGGGFLLRAVSNLSIRAELETSALDSKDFERARFQLVTLGAQYEF